MSKIRGDFYTYILDVVPLQLVHSNKLYILGE